MSENYSLEVKHLRKDIGKRTIIQDLSFGVKKGEVFGFLGPNGAGKTTTIRMIVGLTTPTSGEISIFGQPLATHRYEAMEKVGAIVENPELYPFLTGMENLKQFARMQKNIGKADIEHAVKMVGLERRINDKVKKYSLGMRQRLGLAQALLHKPEILILDEPTNGLDPAGIREIRDYIRRLAKEEGLSVIVSSHLLSEMELMCDRFGIIQNGSIISIEDVHVLKSSKDLNRYILDAFPSEKAQNLLASKGIDFKVAADGTIEFETAEQSLPDLIRELVHADIDLYSVAKRNLTLEDRYIALTEKGGTDIA